MIRSGGYAKVIRVVRNELTSGKQLTRFQVWNLKKKLIVLIFSVTNSVEEQKEVAN